MSDVLVILAPTTAALRKADLSAITFGRKIAEKASAGCDLLMLGPHAQESSEAASRLGAAKVLLVDHDALAKPTAETTAAAVAEVFAGRAYRFAIAAASTTTKDYFPRVAAKLGAGMATDVLDLLDVGENHATFLRAVFAGNLLAEARVDGKPILATCRASAFEPAANQITSAPVETITLSNDIAFDRKQHVASHTTPLERPELTEAEVVVSGGRGTKGDPGFELIHKLADELGAAVGASRAAVDAGWMPNDFQVGQTGKIVAPKLYIAVGLSGAIQHLAGMRNSKTIVAINKDAEAPIFEVADYGLVADLFEAVPALTDALRKARQN